MKKTLSLLSFTLGLMLLLVQGLQAQTAAPIHVLTMEGAIGPAFAGYLSDGLRKAEEDNAQLLVIELSTPGGLLSTTREMVSDIVNAPMPVAVWVTPSGTHAASAGTFILYAAHIAAMNEGTNVGAATPIEMKGQTRGQFMPGKPGEKPEGKKSDEESLRDLLKELGDPNQEAARNKAIQDTAAFIRGLAELRGRNAEWAEKSITEADSLTATEALEKNVIDLIAISRTDLLEKINGRTIEIKGGKTITLNTATAPIAENAPDWKVRFLSVITDPNIAFILMSIGMYGLILEFYNPGTMIPGTLGAICLVLGLYALNVLPINMAGVVLMLLGVGFIIAEAFVPSFGILGFGGLIAFIVGATIMFDTQAMPGLAIDWGVIWGIALLGAIIVGLIVFLTLKVYRREPTTGTESMVGNAATVVEWDDQRGRVRIQGEIWQAESEETLDLSEGDEVLVSKAENLLLKIRPKV